MKVENYAEDLEWAQTFVDGLLADFNQIRTDRLGREESWSEAYDLWSLGSQDPSNRRNYLGRANLNLPQVRKEIETMARRLNRALFPEDFLKADPNVLANQELALVNTQTVHHFLERVMAIKGKTLPWVKQGVLYGTSPAKIFWKKEVNKMLYKERDFFTDERGILQPKFKQVFKDVTLYNGPKFQLRDIFSTWVYPTNITDVSDIQRVYSRTKVRFSDLKNSERTKENSDGVYVNLDKLKDLGKVIDQENIEVRARMASLGENQVLVGSEDNQIYTLLEIWGKDYIKGKLMNFVVEIIMGDGDALKSGIPIRIQQNPLWHQSPPFVFNRFILAPGVEFYGRGLPEAVASLQAQLDDVLNQSMDSTTLSLNPVTIVNPAYAPNLESFEIEPNAIWWANPDGVKPFTFPDLSDVGIKNAGLLRSFITEMSDNSPQLPDPIAGKARSTGQAQLAINEWQTDLFSFVGTIIQDAMIPLAKQVHSLIQQNISDDEIIRLSGKYAGSWVNRIVTPNDIVGNYDFQWIGAIQIENQTVKTQQLLTLLKILPSLPADAGVKLNWQNLMIKLFRDGFQIPDVQNLVETEQFNQSIPPDIENRIMKMRGEVVVSQSDDDSSHIAEHRYGLTQLKPDQVYERALFARHITLHEHQAAKKQAAIQQQQQMQMMMLSQGKPPGQHPGMMPQPPRGPGRPPNPMGNQAQMSESTNPADFERGLRL